MNERSNSPQEKLDTADSGAAPWEWEYIGREWIDSQLIEESEDDSFQFEAVAFSDRLFE
jgi:hypothetical protein